MKRRSLKLKVASPCNADWDKMSGDEAIRHCKQCDKNVYHLSHMSNEQVESLLERADEQPCVRFYERPDGSVLLGDCPVGNKKTRRKRTAIGVGAAMLSAVGLAIFPGIVPTSWTSDKSEQEHHSEQIMGMMAVEKPEPKPEQQPPPVMMGGISKHEVIVEDVVKPADQIAPADDNKAK